jgi:dihydrofolate synthase/folylpolyglutamate synthase
MYSRVGAAAYKKDLTNTVALCEHLGNPHQRFRSIHIGGTNGKGSTSHMLASILQASGYKTGLYTSPHLYDFRERIKVDGEMIPEEKVVSFIDNLKPLIEKIEPSFFEITVAMAFEYFAEKKVDIAVVEVGLGGRLDSTNVIDPICSVITNISLDHTAMLGNSVQEIAREKAGIIKRGKPVIIGERQEATDNIFFQKADSETAPLLFAADEYAAVDYHWTESGLNISVKNKKKSVQEDHLLDLGGIYQTKNICTVLTTVDQLRDSGFTITRDALKKGLQETKKNTSLSGRWEILQKSPLVVADVAHNEGGIREVLLQLQNMEFGKLHIVIGMVKDKAIDQILDLLPRSASYYFTQADIPRALPAESLQVQAAFYKIQGKVFSSVNEALIAATRSADKDDCILVCGSIFLIAEIDKSLFSN